MRLCQLNRGGFLTTGGLFSCLFSVFRPSVTDYLATLENPAGVFRTLTAELGGEPAFERDLYGDLRFRAGNSAAIFTYMRGRERRFLKLYVRPNLYLREIYDYVSRAGSPILPRVRLLRDELFVLSPGGGSGWVDVVEGEWSEGVTLDRYAPDSRTRPLGLRDFGKRTDLRSCPARVLAAAFEDLCRELRAAEWAHGDLKPENIIVRPNGKMTLVDCDAMWIPSFGEPTADYPAGRPAVELGTPPWASPERLSSRLASPSLTAAAPAFPFDKSIDNHPMARIAEWLRSV